MDSPEGTRYPDPSTLSYGPYPSQYQPSQPYSQPYDGGNNSFWTAGPQPPVHEGFIPRDNELYDEDPENDFRNTASQYELNNIVNPWGSDHVLGPAFADSDGEDGMGMDDEELTSDLLSTQTPAAVAVPTDNPEVDSDFDAEASEIPSGDEMSDESDGLDAIINSISPRGRGKRGRGSRGGRGRGRGRRGWKWALKGTEHEAKPAGKRGRPRGSQVPRGEGRRRGVGPGPKYADPGDEYKKLQKRATECFLSGDLESALGFARSAIKANPEVFGAHSLLSEILLAQGNEIDSMTVLYAGAHTKRDPALWHHVAERQLEIAGDNRSQRVLDSAIYAYTWVNKLDRNDYDARREKLNLLLEDYNSHGTIAALSRARNECKMMMRFRPSDMPVIHTYAELASTQDEYKTAKKFFDDAIQIYIKGKTLGDEEEEWSYLNVYADLVNRLDGPREAILQVKKLSRWFLGRSQQTFWDDHQTDDREFDIDDEPRRRHIEEHQQEFPSSAYGEGLPTDIRIKLGLYRLALGQDHHKEASHHLQFLQAYLTEVGDYGDLFLEVGTALAASKLFAEAITFLEPLQDIPDFQEASFYMKLASCYKGLDRKIDAEDCYKVIVEENDDHWQSRVELAKMYEEQGRGEEALPLIDRVIQLGRNDALVEQNVLIRPKTKVTVADAEIKSNIIKKKTETTPKQPKEPIVRGPRGPYKRRKLLPDPNSQDDQGPLDEALPGGHAPLTPSASSADGADEEDDPMDLVVPEEEEGTLKSRKSTQRARGRAATKSKTPKRVGKKADIMDIATQYKDSVSKGRKGLSWDKDERIRMNWDIIKYCNEDTEAGDEDAIRRWIDAAGAMLDDFQSTRVFYPGKDKHIRFSGYGTKSRVVTEMEAMRDRLQEDGITASQRSRKESGIPDDFNDILFSEWLDIFCKYALHMARQEKPDKCYTTLQQGYIANVYYNWPEAAFQIHATWLACALILNDDEKICTVSRWFMTTYPFSHGPISLFAAVNRLYAGSPNWFNAGPTQKYLLRTIKSMDYHLLPTRERSTYNFTTTERSSYTASGKKEANWPGLDGLDPSLLTLYGHVMAAAQTWPSALNYYFRALALVPEDATVNLSIGLAYIQNAMKRQVENRHWQVLQGLSFLGRYREYRLRKAHFAGILQNRLRCEVEFNFARAWHLLGISHLALQGYEKCLGLVGAMEREAREGRDVADGGPVCEGDEDEGFAQEAAFALVQLYSLAGNEKAARRVTERYLVI